MIVCEGGGGSANIRKASITTDFLILDDIITYE